MEVYYEVLVPYVAAGPSAESAPSRAQRGRLGARIAREGFGPTASDASPAPTASVGADAEPATAASSPGWLRDAQWQVTPGRLPDLPPAAPDHDGPLSASPFEHVDARTVPDVRRRSMGAPFLNAAPQDYPSHLGPVPQGPDWEQVVPGPTPWSPLAPTARATDWGKVLTGIECRRTEDGGHHECLSPGGRRFTVPTNEAFPDYIGPGQPNYHYYNITAPGRRRNEMPGIIAGPTPGPFWSVAPATAEGTPNPAAPAYVQILQYLLNRIPGVERGLGSPSWPVTSYTVVDQYGRPAVINVTHPDHPGSPGIVIRTDERLPSGRHRVRNEGAGVSRLQNPNLLGVPGGPLDRFTHYLWEAQSRDNINRAHRNSRYVNRAHRNFRDGLPLE